jgi:glycosyl transferase family 25
MNKKYILSPIVLLLLIVIYFKFEMPKKRVSQKIDKVYVINLDKDKARWKKVKSDLDKQGITNYERFSAVWGLDIKFRSEDGKTFTGQALKDKKVIFRIGEKYKVMCPNVTFTYEYDPSIERRRLRAGEFGCICSHLEVMNKIIDNKEIAMVLEDDVLMVDNFKYEVDFLMKNSMKEKNWDIIFLALRNTGATKAEKFFKMPTVVSHPHISRLKDFTPSRAYIANGYSAGNILAKHNIYTAIDDHFTYLVQKFKDIKIYYFNHLDMQDSYAFGSIINEMDAR